MKRRFPQGSRLKYKNVKEMVDGRTFDSRKEAARYRQLKLLHLAGEISEPECQPSFRLGTDAQPVLIKSKGYPNGRRATYRGDFRYLDLKSGDTVVEDVKGMDTPISRLKRAIVEAQYDVTIQLL